MSMAQVVDLCSSDESDDDGEGRHSRGPTLPVLSVPGGRQRTRPVPSKVRGEELFGMVYYAIDDDAHDVDFEEEDQKMPAFPGLPPPPPPPVWHRKRPRRDVIDLSSTAATTTMMTTTTAGPIVPSSSAAQMHPPAYQVLLEKDQVLLEKVQPPPTTTTTGPFIPPSAAAAAAAHNISTPSWPVVVEKVVQPCKATTPRERVLEVFPDVATDHVDKLLRDCLNSVEMVTSILSDGSYPKSKREDGQMGPTKMTPSASSVLVTRQRGVKPLYNYTSVSSFQATPEYREEAVQMLLYEFPFIRVDSMRKWFREHQQRLTLVRNHILELLKKTQSRTTRNTSNQDPELLQFRALKPVWATKRPSTEQVECLGEKHCMKRFIRRPKPNLTDPILIDEVQYAQHQLEAWMEAMDEKQKRYDARTRADQVGNGVECGCCFDKVPFEEMVACKSEGHLFCMDCIQRYAETQIFSNATLGVIKATGRQACELLCCDASGCQSGFHGEHLERTLNVKTLERYTELQFRASIEGAGMSEEICSCPKCGFQAYLPLNLIIFECPVDDCRYESCRKCGKEPHVPLRCEEVVQLKRQDEGRLKVEEALAEAKIRKCPKCTTPFVKSDGCNKMTCRCGTKMCYICRQELKGQNPYGHFCQRPHCDHKTCQNCVLFSNAEEDDKRAMREAGLGAAETYRQELQEKGASGPEVHIDVDRIMTTGVVAAAAVAATLPRPVFAARR